MSGQDKNAGQAEDLPEQTETAASGDREPRLAHGTDLPPLEQNRRRNKRASTARDGIDVVSMSPPLVVLAIVGDAEDYEGVLDWIRMRGLIVEIVGTSADGIAAHRENGADLVLLGLPLPDTTAAPLIEQLRQHDPRATIVIVGEDADVRSQLTALELGAQEYIPDAIAYRRDLLFALGMSLGGRSTDPHLRMLRGREAARAQWQRIIAQSPPMAAVMRALREICERSSATAAPAVLFTGELGTGKHLLSRALHYNGPRRQRAFAEINCAAFAHDELRVQLFGRAHGSARQGLFETADGGTLFLDEIGALPPELQRDVLVAIEDRWFTRVGSEDLVRSDVQIVAGTRVDLGAMLKRDQFRADLYHRLSVRSIALPPLRARGADILAIADVLLAELAAEAGRRPPQLSLAAREALAAHTWPGNIRELRNELERIVLTVEDAVINADQFRFARSTGTAAIEVRGGKLAVSLSGDHCPIDRLEYEVIREALARCRGNISHAARFLGITRQTMLYRMKKHGLRGPTDDE